MRRQTYKDNLGVLRDQLLSYTDIQELYDILESEMINTRKDLFSDGIVVGLTPTNSGAGILQVSLGTFYQNGERIVIGSNQNLDFSAQANGTYYVYATYTEIALTRAVPQDRLLPPTDQVHRRSDYQFALSFSTSSGGSNIKVCSLTVSGGLITGISTAFRDIFRLNYVRLNPTQAGNGLVYSLLTNILDINIDNDTLEVSSDVLQIKSSIYAPQKTYTVVVASNDASAQEKRLADYVCDFNGDESEINDAIVDCNAYGGGIVKLVGKAFQVAGFVYMLDDVILEGQGVQATSITKQSTYTADAIVILFDGTRNAGIRDFAVNGAKSLGVNTGTHNSISLDGAREIRISDISVLNSYSNNIYLTNACRDIIIRNAKITGANQVGIKADLGCYNIYIFNNSITLNGLASYVAGSDGGICVDNMYDSKIINNTITDNYGEGIYINTNSYNCIIKGNNCSTNTNFGIYIVATSSSNNIISNNTCNSNVRGITDAGYNTISNNICKSNTDYGIYAGEEDRIIGNNCEYNTNYNIRCTSGCDIVGNRCNDSVYGVRCGGGCTVVGNDFGSNSSYGIYAIGFGGTFCSNTILGGTYAIYVSGSSYMTINSNTITNANYGVYITNTTHVTSCTNVFYNCSVSDVYLTNNSDKNNVQCNTCRSTVNTVVIATADCNNNVVTNNVLYKAISDSGTGTITTAGNQIVA